MHTPSKTLIIFDVDGTLVDGNKRGSRCFANCYEHIFGQPFPSINWSTYPHVTDTTIFRTVIQNHFGRLPNASEMWDFHDYYVTQLEEIFEREPHGFQPIAGTHQLIEYLTQREDVVLGIATGGWKKAGQVKLNHIKVPHDAFIFYGADGHTTRAEIIQSVIQEATALPVNITRTVYVGDAIWDVETTRALDMPFIGIRHRGDLEKLTDYGAHHVISNYYNPNHFWTLIQEAQPPKPL